MAQVRNPRHVKALVAGCAALGVRLRPGCLVYGLESQGERVTTVRTSAGSLTAGRYLVASGAWTDSLLAPLGRSSDIRPVRGQIALLRLPAPLVRRVVLQGKGYLVPRPDGRVLVGSTEEDAGFDKSTTAEAVSGLLAFALRLVPGLAAAALERCWAGLRPGSPDGWPFLGAVPGYTNLFIAAGHFRAGIQLSPATALVTKELLLGQTATVPVDAFRLGRTSVSPHRVPFRS
jgi:glycine oxidase